MNIEELLYPAIRASIIAGKAVMHYYNSTFEIEYKEDKSPLTSADNASHEAIVSILSGLGIPILSEEGKNIPYEIRKNWEYLWLVDPLDGTKEFINHNGEFTVNIALIRKGIPILGVIYLPVTGDLYFGSEAKGAFRYKVENESDLSESNIKQLIAKSIKLPIQNKGDQVTILGSRSHQTPENLQFIDKMVSHFTSLNIVNAGSSLKFCRLAEGTADIYPRLGPTMEWDTAAGHGICKSAGIKVLQFNTNEDIKYNKPNLLNPWFIAVRPEFEQYL